MGNPHHPINDLHREQFDSHDDGLHAAKNTSFHLDGFQPQVFVHDGVECGHALGGKSSDWWWAVGLGTGARVVRGIHGEIQGYVSAARKGLASLPLDARRGKLN